MQAVECGIQGFPHRAFAASVFSRDNGDAVNGNVGVADFSNVLNRYVHGGTTVLQLPTSCIIPQPRNDFSFWRSAEVQGYTLPVVCFAGRL